MKTDIEASLISSNRLSIKAKLILCYLLKGDDNEVHSRMLIKNIRGLTLYSWQKVSRELRELGIFEKRMLPHPGGSRIIFDRQKLSKVVNEY